MYYTRLLTLAVIYLMITSCSPKNTTTTATIKAPVSEPEITEERLTPCTTFDDLSRNDRDRAETAYVLYRDFLKAKDYAEAYKQWNRAYQLAPGSNGRVTYQYEDGVIIYGRLAELASTTIAKSAYVDTIMMIYDKRAACFGDQAYVDGRKAFDYYYKYPESATESQTFDLFKGAVEAKGPDTDYFVVNPFTKMLYDKLVADEISKEEGLPLAKTLVAAIAKGKATCKGQLCDTWATIDGYASARLEALEGIDDFYDCDYFVEKYYQQYLADSSNCETIELAYRRMLGGNCAKDLPALAEISAAKESKCYTPPPPPGPLRLGYDCYTEGRYKCAVEQFETFVNKTDDIDKQAKYLMTIAKIYYGDIKNFPQARKYALQAAALKDNWGDPYLLIGKLYASSGPLCGPGTGWDSQVVTWVAIDKFAYAKQIDPSVNAEANKWINTYSQYMPSKADVFQRPSINEGDTYRVGCWINETTTVRVAKK